MFFFEKFPFSFPSHDQNKNGKECSPPHENNQKTAACLHLSLEGPPDALVTIGNRHYHYFAGHAYLGLQAHPSVLAATCEATLRYGTGTGTTRFALTAPPVFDVERRAAQSLKAERAFYYVSGYLGPQILLETLDRSFDRLFVDEASDKGIHHAVKTWNGKTNPVCFRHNDPDSLRLELHKHLKASEKPLVMTNGVFSASGNIAPLDRYARILAETEGSSLLVDDSHAIGVIGQNGRGTYEHFGVAPNRINQTAQDLQNDLFTNGSPSMSPSMPFDFYHNFDDSWQQIENGIKNEEFMNDLPVRYYHSAALTKAIGGSGGIIAGSDRFIDQLIERSHAYGNISSPPSPLAAGTAEAIALTFENTELRQKLRDNTRYFKEKILRLGLPVNGSDVPIVSLSQGSAANMRRIQRKLSEQGILIAYLPRNHGLPADGLLRISIFATHTREMLDQLTEQLEKLL
ncbi:MAG: pyridoxal phosphate-dependent aminotransferase family protein [Planctomycetaceae bacterium]|nr:pyridoxal phosphate-dependent aminotransferase family protein [Planctomycetaceae bacterium]